MITGLLAGLLPSGRALHRAGDGVTSQPFHFPLEEDALELARDRARIEGVVVGVYRDPLGFFVSVVDLDADRVYTEYIESHA